MLANLVRVPTDGIVHHIHTLVELQDFFELGPGMVTSGAASHQAASPRLWSDLRATFRAFRPDVVHAWMYHANLMAALARVGSPAIVWSIHNGELVPGQAKRSTILVDKMCARLSRRVPDRIVYVSRTVRDIHERKGYDPARGVIISNGVDLRRFMPPPTPPERDPGAPLRLALVGRYDPIKGQHFLIDAVADHPMRDRFHLILAGRDCDTAPKIRDHVASRGLESRCTLLGATRAVEQIYAQADIVVMPSYAEAFPVTLLEAAASGAVIVSSRVGEVARLGFADRFLFDVGSIAGCISALAAAAGEVERPTGVREENRRIAEQFGLDTMVDRYHAMYREVAARRDRP